jgi:hypothetical protein
MDHHSNCKCLTRGGMYADIQIVKCFAPNNFSTCL